MEEEERGISLGEIFKVIFRRVWWVVGVTAAFMLVFTLVIQFWYNRNKEYYNVSYTLEYPGISSGNYPDGTTLRIADLISYDTLGAVVEKNGDEFKDIDIKAMVNQDGITVKKVNEDDATVSGLRLTLTVDGKYFQDAQQASAFVKAVANYPVDYVNRIAALDYKFNIEAAYNDSVKYSERIGYLSAQANYLTGMYNELISICGQNYRVNGDSLGTYLLNVSNIFDSNVASELNAAVNANRIVYDTVNYGRDIAPREIVLRTQLEANEKKLAALKEERDAILKEPGIQSSTNLNIEAFNSAIASLTTSNVDIRKELEDIEYIRTSIANSDETWYATKAAFDERLEDYRVRLAEATEKFIGVRIAVYNEKSAVSFDANRVSPQGGINIVIAAVLGAVVGFIIIGVIVWIIDGPQYLRERKAAIAAAEIKAEGKPEESSEKKVEEKE